MTDVDIFATASAQPRKTSWADLSKIGNKVSGIYIGKFEKINNYNTLQVVYQLLQKDGSIFNVGFAKTKKPVIDRMDQAKFGTIVGFQYTQDGEFVNRAGTKTKFHQIDPFFDDNIVDTEWLANNPRANDAPVSTPTLKPGYASATEDAYNNIPANVPDVPFVDTRSLQPEQKLALILSKAGKKFGITDQAQIKEKLMEETSIAFIPSNYDEMLDILDPF